MTAKISVIMPMYNVEKYVGYTIASLLNQTFKDFEAIFVDDHSTDNTLEVIKIFNDPRIKIIRNEKNLGMPGAVRNIGLEIANGDYIYFLDNDDVMLPNCLELLYNTIKKSDADVATSITALHCEDKYWKPNQNIPINPIKQGTLDKVSPDLKQRVLEEVALHHTHCAVWLSLFKRSMIEENHIRFPNCVAEDLFWLFDVVCATSKIEKIEEPIYVWRVRETSATHDFSRLKKNVEAILKLAKYVEEKLNSFGVDDLNFMDIISAILKSPFNYYVFKLYEMQNELEHSQEFLHELKNALIPTFGENAQFITSLMHNFMLEIIQKKNLERENEQLKIILINLQKHIEESKVI